MAVTATSSTPTLSSPGLGSGLDVNGLVSKLMTVESRPLTALTTQTTSFQAKLSAYGSLQGALSSLQTAALAMSTTAKLTSFAASVADPTVFAASADSTASAGSYNIVVGNLASAQTLRSHTGITSSAQFAAGTLTLDFGTYGTSSFTPDASRSKTLTIDGTNNTIQGVRDAINGTNFGVTASIVTGSDGSHLVIASNSSGAANALRVTVNQTGTTPTGGADLTTLAYDASGGSSPMDLIGTAAQNASLTVDGMPVTSASNVVTGAIQGLTLNLAKTGTTTLTVAKSVSTAFTAVQGFVGAYNAVNTQIRNATAFDATTGTASVLTGDATTRTIQAQLRNILNSVVSGAPSGSSTLSAFGISFQKDGSLALDSSKLTTALNDPNKDITKLFASGGYAVQVNTAVASMLNTGGLLAGRTAGINSSITAISKQSDALTLRLAAIQKNYLAQFTKLDSLISSMNSTSTYLTQQLASIAAITNQTKA
ncbi:MAG: flagellar filament capping protein FliD [Rhodocyclaceae bacterium]|nr:flagellar filament capping protein FliD [Rhodocyclaceae bacterium]